MREMGIPEITTDPTVFVEEMTLALAIAKTRLSAMSQTRPPALQDEAAERGIGRFWWPAPEFFPLRFLGTVDRRFSR